MDGPVAFGGSGVSQTPAITFGERIEDAFRIDGRYTRGCAEGPFSIDAPSAEEARRQAEGVGIIVHLVTPVSTEASVDRFLSS